MPSDSRVRAAMAALAENLSRPADAGETLSALTAAARDTIPGVDHASINIVRKDGRIDTVAPTEEWLRELDAMQFELEEGPCYEAATASGVLVSEDVADDARWPRYGPRAGALGVHAQMAVDLSGSGHERATLNLYSRSPWRFADALEVADLFASHASLILGFAITSHNLNAALESRKVIGQAVGIVMERYSLDEDRAFGFLVRTSKDSNVKLRVIAGDVVDGHNRRHRPVEPTS